MNKTTKSFLVILLCFAAMASFAVPVLADESNSYLEDISTDETMLIIPIITMFEENGVFLFTTLFIGISLGVGGTLFVQYFIRKRNK